MQDAVLITGATGGLGEEFAKQYAALRRPLVLTARNEDSLKALAEVLPVETKFIALDLSKEGEPQKLVDFVIDNKIEVTTLVNNAGFAIGGETVESSDERQRALVNLNCGALTELCVNFAAIMKEQGRGEILNVASVAGFMVGPYLASYYGSKNYVLSFSRALHFEMKKYSIQVMALCPPPVDTPFWKAAGSDKTIVAKTKVTSKSVVSCALRAMKFKKQVCVPGILWKIACPICRAMPHVTEAATAALQLPRG